MRLSTKPSDVGALVKAPLKVVDVFSAPTTKPLRLAAELVMTPEPAKAPIVAL